MPFVAPFVIEPFTSGLAQGPARPSWQSAAASGSSTLRSAASTGSASKRIRVRPPKDDKGEGHEGPPQGTKGHTVRAPPPAHEPKYMEAATHRPHTATTMDEMAAAIQAEKPTPTTNADGNPNRPVSANSFEPVVQALHNHQPTVVMAPLINAPRDEVVVTDNDVL